MAIFMMLIAGIFAASSNLCMRRSIDRGGSSQAFLVVQLFLSFVVALMLNPLRTGCWHFDLAAAGLGILGGVILGAMMWALGQALEKGPPGLSIAALNSATVMPGVVMALLFGSAFGFAYTSVHAFGSALVVLGLFWAGWSAPSCESKKRWAFFTLMAFALHAVLLSFLQWRALLLRPSLPHSPWLPLRLFEETSQWFMPMIFLCAATMQLLIYLGRESRTPKRSEVGYGALGGIFNGICTYLLIRAPEVASATENAMIFPIFAVSVMVLCNCWGRAFYKERVNWVASSVCMGGLFLATVDWAGLLTA